ncbi:Beta-amylase [Hexamita inflata]|uniref:Beta-amylase n=1 Tax=Hexamita inflata TaxID=28002 RepID=A0ABP1IZ67_9EUKA
MLSLIQILNVNVNVMMPLDTIKQDGTVKDMSFVQNSLKQLKAAGVNGIMMDVWWGIAEPQPNVYKFDGYFQVIDFARSIGLHVEPVMSFHKCGGNVGDSVTIPLPSWALDKAKSAKLLYMDQWGAMSEEYIAASADYQKVFPTSGSALRTPLTIYSEFMQAFNKAMASFVTDGTIDNVQVGLGPCGEMRYPSYPSAKWKYPGVGAFQAFDPLMKKDFQDKAKAAGFMYDSPPTDAGTYNSRPEQANFFVNGYKTTYGNFFLSFYQNYLLTHAQAVLAEAKSVFKNTELAAKVAGIHWWYGTESHAAELTAGYYNTATNNGYAQIEEVLEDVQFDFTCLEMTDAGHANENCNSKPEELVRQVMNAVKQYSGSMGGENALEIYSKNSYDQILTQLRYAKGYIKHITYLRLTNTLLQSGNLQVFTDFVKSAKQI